jgi:NADPH:quinone reductase-like Zn-dependent oxidoreductase
VIDSTYPLTEAAEAIARLRSRQALGKVIVEPFEPVSEAD